MSFVHPHPAPRIRETPDALVVDLPSPRRPLTALVLAFWLIGWAVGMAFVVEQMLDRAPLDADRAFLFVWAFVWGAAGIGALGYLAWLVAGSERLALERGTLAVTHRVGVVGVTRRWPLERIRELRTYGRDIPPVVAFGLDVAGRGTSGVRFRAGERVVRCLRALDEHAAHEVVSLLRARHAFDEPQPRRPEAPAA